MELILARQSVVIKCNLCASTLLGNYEFYYAGGLLCRLAGQIPEQSLKPKEFYGFLQPLLDAYETKNKQEAYLARMLKEYEVSEEYDGQMPKLMQMGLREKNMWERLPAAK